MDFLKQLKNILQTQKDGLKQFEEELSSIEKFDLLNAYDALKKESKAFESGLESLKAEHSVLQKEYRSLKEALSSEIYSQKMNLLDFSKKRVFKLYEDFELNNSAKLAEIESSAEGAFAKIKTEAFEHNQHAKEEIEAKIGELKKIVYEYKQSQEQQLESLKKGFQDQYEKEYSALREQPLSEEQIKKRTRNTNIEMKLGRRITNIVGVVFVLIGVALGLQYTFTNLITSNYVKSGAAFFLGLCFLAGGEVLNRKSRSVFSLGITAGGIAILFTVTGISFFLLELFTMPFAFGLTVLISAAAFLLSLRYTSQTIAVFACAGAFLPFFSINSEANFMFFLGYLLVINLFVLLLYTKKDWSVLKYIGFSLHLIGFLALFLMVRKWEEYPCLLWVGFVAANYLIYVFIPLFSALKNRKKISTGSSVILTINTVFSAVMIFILLDNYRYENLFGLAALIMAAFFIGLGFLVYRTIKNRHFLILFLGMAFVFAVLVIPLQFDSKWISLGWLAEAAGLLIIGIILENKWYKTAGSIILGFSIFIFFVIDFLYGHHDVYYIGKASAITLSCLAVLFCGIFMNRGIKGYLQTFEGRFLRRFKNFAGIVCVIYLFLLNEYFYSGNWHGPRWYNYEVSVVVSAYICFAVSFTFEFLKVLKDKFGRVLQTILIIMGMIINFFLNAAPLSPLLTVFVILADFTAAVLLWLFINRFVNKGKVSREAQSILSSIFVLIVMLQILIERYDYSFNSMVISIILVLASLVLIIVGFIRRYAYQRRFGLFLNLISIIKFFLFDLTMLGKGERIISYFMLGFVLIGISYVYQHFSRKLFREIAQDENKQDEE